MPTDVIIFPSNFPKKVSDLDYACLQMLSEVIANFNESLLVEDEQYVLVVDLFIVRPELQLQVTGDRRASTLHQHLVTT